MKRHDSRKYIRSCTGLKFSGAKLSLRTTQENALTGRFQSISIADGILPLAFVPYAARLTDSRVTFE